MCFLRRSFYECSSCPKVGQFHQEAEIDFYLIRSNIVTLLLTLADISEDKKLKRSWYIECLKQTLIGLCHQFLEWCLQNNLPGLYKKWWNFMIIFNIIIVFYTKGDINDSLQHIISAKKIYHISIQKDKNLMTVNLLPGCEPVSSWG